MACAIRALTLALACFAGVPGWAADLVIGRSTEQSALDPHYSVLGNDVATAQNMFERLIAFDADLRIRPGLALSWTVLDPLTWELKLRPGVRYHDGTQFTGNDVGASLLRSRAMPNSPAPQAGLIAALRDVEVIDPLTVRVHTLKPAPLLMEQIGQIFIVPAKLASATTEDFNAGRAINGTGPYRFRSAIRGDRVVMAANPDYWGGPPAFATVTLKMISNDANRIAALLSGQVDVIEAIPPTDIDALAARPGIALYSVISLRIVYVGLDAARDDSPFMTDKDGRKLYVNPLRDRRVRQALSKMINRATLVERVLAGAGVPSGQMAPEGLGGFDPTIPVPEFDLQGARRLLAEAGYPNGFGLSVHGSSNRFPKDSQIAQALGQMFTRGGLRVNGIDVMPYNVYAPQATSRKFSLFIFSYGHSTSTSQPGISGILATYDAASGLGQLNRARYSNAAFDTLLAQASAEFDAPKRGALLAEATHLAMDDGALLPLYFQKLFWAARAGYTVTPDKGESTSALFVSPAP